MKLMVVDTALGLCTAGVFEVDGAGVRRLGLRSEPMVKGHSERIAGYAREGAAQAGLAFAELDRIGVTVGPGSFTGLRVGLAFAQGLGAALNRPVVGVSALDALAASAGEGATIAPKGASAVALLTVRFHTVTVSPRPQAASTKAAPRRPVPRKAMRGMESSLNGRETV